MLDLQRSVMGLCYAFGPIWKIRFYSLPFPFLGNPLDGMGGAAPPQPLDSIPSLYTLLRIRFYYFIYIYCRRRMNLRRSGGRWKSILSWINLLPLWIVPFLIELIIKFRLTIYDHVVSFLFSTIHHITRTALNHHHRHRHNLQHHHGHFSGQRYLLFFASSVCLSVGLGYTPSLTADGVTLRHVLGTATGWPDEK